MVRPVVRGLLAVVLFSSACTAGAVLEQGPGITGTYVVNGVDPLGTEYAGRLEITASSDPGVFLFDWIVTGAILHGEGTIAGNRLAVVWETVNAPGGVSTGTAEYEILDDGRIVGTRSVDGFEGVGTEEIFPQP